MKKKMKLLNQAEQIKKINAQTKAINERNEMKVGMLTFSKETRSPYCAKCKKKAMKVTENPNRWKKYSRNNDHLMTACCQAKIIWK
jgi:hypothetical protein